MIDKNDALITGAKQIIDHVQKQWQPIPCEKDGRSSTLDTEETCTESFYLKR